MTSPLPELVWTGPDQRIERAVRHAQLFVLSEPVVAQRLYAALARHGREIASTPEGAARREALAHSPLLARVRALWEPATLNLLEADATTAYPSGYLDALLDVLDLEDVELLIARLGSRGGRG